MILKTEKKDKILWFILSSIFLLYISIFIIIFYFLFNHLFVITLFKNALLEINLRITLIFLNLFGHTGHYYTEMGKTYLKCQETIPINTSILGINYFIISVLTFFYVIENDDFCFNLISFTSLFIPILSAFLLFLRSNLD